MPFLRFTRDRRGYEHTYVLHADREQGHPRLRILYWFRTPPGVKVGRAALDEEAIRMLEAGSPGLRFDWARMLRLRPVPAAEPTERRRRSRRASPPGAVKPTRAGAPGEASPRMVEPSDPRVGGIDETLGSARAAETGSAEPMAIATELAVPEVGPAPLAPRPEAPNAVAALLGDEGLAVLRARYAELKTRLATRVSDPVRRERLRIAIEALNPDTWVTEADARAGIERFEQRYAELRRQMNPRRRRHRRSRAGGAAAGGDSGPGSGSADQGGV